MDTKSTTPSGDPASLRWETRPHGARHKFKLKPSAVKFWRGPTICACQTTAAGPASLVETRVVSPLPAKVVGKLFLYKQRPLDGEIVTVRVDPAAASTVDLDSGTETLKLDLTANDAGPGMMGKKKLLLWCGDASDLGGAAWDDIVLVNVTGSGDLPYQLYLTARCGGSEAKLGLLDVLMEDPEGSGMRTARYGMFRTRTPRLKFSTPNLSAGDITVHLDDGDDATDDELDITSLVALSAETTAVDEVAGWVDLSSGVCTGITNTAAGRRRLYQESIETPPEGGDCALFIYGENRLQLKQGDTLIYCAHSFHYLRDGETVPSARYDADEVVIDGLTRQIIKNSLSLDFKSDTNDEGVSRTLHALRLPPRSFAGTFNIVEGGTHKVTEGPALLTLRDQIAGFKDPSLESVTVTPLVELGANDTGVFERIPEALHGDFVPANHTFTNRDHHWHHFVIHTFPAHRLIESQLFIDRRPPQVALSGVHFDTNKTFIRPEGADDIRRINELNADEPSRKIAIFGHTDRVGGDDANNQLSLVRARSMDALLRHKVGFWFDRFHAGNEAIGPGTPELQWALKETGDFTGAIDGTDSAALQAALAAYKSRKGLSGSTADFATRAALAKDVRAKIGAVNEPLTHETGWGVREIQLMLTELGKYSGPINGVNDTPTSDAVKAEQGAHNLTQDGDVGLSTRVELIRDYMASLLKDPIPDGRFHPGAVFGCGEAFPLVPTPDNVESQQNRRVEAVFRKTPINPINPALLGSAVPYKAWLAPEFEEGEDPSIPKVVVAITDTGFGRAGDNFSGEQLTQPNDLMIKGERWARPTSVRGIAAGNANAALVSLDGDLRAVADVPGPLTRPAASMGHGSVCSSCMAADGIGTPVGAGPRGPLDTVLGTGPHIKVRPISDPLNLFTMLLTLEIIASDPDVLVFSTSVGFTVGFGPPLPLSSPAQIRSMQQRATEVLMQGKLIVCLAHNHSFAAGQQGFYHTGRTQWGSQGPDRRNARSSNTGANVAIQRMLVVGNSARVGTGAAPISALTAAPGVREDVSPRTLIGETVGVQMPGTDIRGILPSAAGMGLTNAAVIAGQNTRIGGASGTSFSTPMTAGVAGELLLLDPDLRQPANAARVIEYIEATADPLQNTNPAGGGAAPGNPRVSDPIIAGNAGHPAFTNIRRVHFWKAVLAALNKGLSSEGRGANGAADALFTFCTLRDDSATIWYGFELRSWIADAVIWLRKPTGEFVLAQDAGALFPNDRVTGTAWRTVDAFELAPGQPLPAFPWTLAEFTAAGRQPLFLCQISIEKVKLQKFQSLVMHLPGVDPRDPSGASGPPVLELRVDNRASLRSPAAAGGAITAFVSAFDDFVFHVTVVPQAFSKFVFFVQDNRTGAAIGETINVRIFAVDAFGNMTRPPAGALTLSHTGTPGTAGGPAGVFINGAPAAAAGTALAFGAAADPPSLARIQFQGNTAQTVVLSVTGNPGSGSIQVSAPGPLAALHLELRRPGGASAVDPPPRTAEQLELVVRAVDAGGLKVTNFGGEVTISLVNGQPGSDGPPAKSGVHIKATEAAPFSAAAFRRKFTTTGATPDNGEHVFTFFNYTGGTVRFKAASGAIEGTSRDLQFRGGTIAKFQLEVTSPQTAGSEFTVEVTPLDSAGNRIEDFEGAVTLSTVAGKGTAPALGPPRAGVFIANTSLAADDTYTFSHEDGGVHVFPVTGYTVETVQFQASHAPAAGGGPFTGNSKDIKVQAAGALAKFGFERRGADRAGIRFELKVTAQDAAGHQLSNFAGNVTLSTTKGTAFAAGPPAVGVQFETAPGVAGNAHLYVAADNGVFTFLITGNTAETINIRATSGAINSDSGDIALEGAVFDHFSVVPAAAQRNVPFNVVVTANDGSNNVAPHFLGSVSLQVSQGGGPFAPIPGAAHVFVDADNSTFTFAVTLTTSGPGHQIRATDGNITNQPSAVFNVAP